MINTKFPLISLYLELYLEDGLYVGKPASYLTNRSPKNVGTVLYNVNVYFMLRKAVWCPGRWYV
jgi:hypothetical protein